MKIIKYSLASSIDRGEICRLELMTTWGELGGLIRLWVKRKRGKLKQVVGKRRGEEIFHVNDADRIAVEVECVCYG